MIDVIFMEDIKDMSAAQLREYAKNHGLKISGTKEELLRRIEETIEEEDEGDEEYEEDTQEEEYVTLSAFQELGTKVDVLEKKLIALAIQSRRLMLRSQRFWHKEAPIQGKRVSNPTEVSLDRLEKLGYCPTEVEYDLGDSEKSEKDKKELRTELENELSSIQESISENYYFKIPDFLFRETIPLGIFLERTDARLENGVLRLNENIINLAEIKSQKHVLTIGKHTIRFIYYGDTWLVNAD